ncbi:MAG: SgcJ/EcaC family oxidoreductase [Acidobacteria bacterium]|nr:SgcJ/EcaC family oxidoreductase [Acidobacteriota bacterium]
MSAPADETFEAMVADYMDAFGTGDFERVASHYAEDVVSCPPFGGEIRGRSALIEFYKQAFAQAAPKLSDYQFEYKITGDDVIVRESWTATVETPDGATQVNPGRGMWAARRGSGSWKCYWLLARFDPPAQT